MRLAAATLLVGLLLEAVLVEPSNACECPGIWLTVSVTDSAPPVWAKVKPPPWWIGSRPRKSGTAKVLWPSPP